LFASGRTRRGEEVARLHRYAKYCGQGIWELPQESMASPTAKIFVLADTHNRLPEKVSAMAAEADEIWHLGDVCAERILDELRALGPPVTLVRGNCDSQMEWPLVVDLERGGLKFRLQHIPPERPPENIDVVLHGHTHVPRNERLRGVLFLNPGCVTRPNQGAAASVAWLELQDGKLNWRPVGIR
jgi:hypothetical protein